MGAAAGRSADAARQVSPCPNRLAAKSEAKAGYGRRLFRGGLRGPGLRERRASARARGDPHRRRGRRDGVRAPPAPRSAERRQRRPAPRASPLPRRMSLSDNIKTTPPDKRFPTQNQANHCWNRAAAASDRLRRLSPDWFFPPRAGPGNVPRPPRARPRAARNLDGARARAATNVDGERAQATTNGSCASRRRTATRTRASPCASSRCPSAPTTGTTNGTRSARRAPSPASSFPRSAGDRARAEGRRGDPLSIFLSPTPTGWKSKATACFLTRRRGGA